MPKLTVIFEALQNVRVQGKSYAKGDQIVADPELVDDLIGLVLAPAEVNAPLQPAVVEQILDPSVGPEISLQPHENAAPGADQTQPPMDASAPEQAGAESTSASTAASATVTEEKAPEEKTEQVDTSAAETTAKPKKAK